MTGSFLQRSVGAALLLSLLELRLTALENK